MPSISFSNPLKALDLTAFDVRKINVREIGDDVRSTAEGLVRRLPVEQARKTVAPVAKVARDAAYVAVGVGVIATQRVNAGRYDLRQRVNGVQQRITEVAPRVRDEAQATAERVISEASEKVRALVDRRKNATAAA
ncbi:MAG: hypothetical protein RLZ40_766 [Actinomycetota bacterium]|jgi:hypothetical protein